MIAYEAKPTWPKIEEREILEIRGERVYYMHNGKRIFCMKTGTYSGIFETRDQAKDFCIKYWDKLIGNLQIQLKYRNGRLDECKKL